MSAKRQLDSTLQTALRLTNLSVCEFCPQSVEPKGKCGSPFAWLRSIGRRDGWALSIRCANRSAT